MLTTGQVYAQRDNDLQLANEYLLKGDKKKALALYQELARDEAAIPVIHNNYFNLLLDLSLFNEAHSYLRKIIRRDPGNIYYRLDEGYVFLRAGEVPKAEVQFKQIVEENKENVQRIKAISEYFLSHSLPEYGIQALERSRMALRNPNLYNLDLAMLYRVQGNNEKMVEEYLDYVTQNSGNIQYVKNVMQALLTSPQELETLEMLLMEKVQQSPDVEVYTDLLMWVSMQQKNFYGAFVQARAYDKRYKKEGEKSLEVARVALDNEDYEMAAKIYRFVSKEFSNPQNLLLARLGLIRTREMQIKQIYPVRVDSVKSLIKDYEAFIEEYPQNPNAYEAARSTALLLANYLDSKDSAAHVLQSLIANPRTSAYLKSKAKLDLGDIYLLKNEPWESTLLYSQVEKTQKENALAYEAKLKNAKLSYYKGDFKLAQEHLDILKEATSREISNDAIELSVRIKENIAFDSAGTALKEFASVELDLIQHKDQDALKKLEKIKQGFAADGSPLNNYTILDDVYWLMADIYLKRGDFATALEYLRLITKEYPDDVLADDAYFLQAEIHEKHLNDLEKGKELYREFLNLFPGSVFAAEARKRYRILRGDYQEGSKPQF